MHHTTFRNVVMRCDECDHRFYVELVHSPLILCPQCKEIIIPPHLKPMEREELFDVVKSLPEMEVEQEEIEKALRTLSWYDGNRDQVTACWYEILHSDHTENQVYDLLRYLEHVILQHSHCL